MAFDYGIFLSNTDEFVGSLSVMNINWVTGKSELGYWINSENEGKGLISESVKLIEDYIFSRGFNKIEIRCTEDNLRSIAIAKKFNYHFDGKIRDDLYEHGEFRNTLVYSKTKKERSL